MKILALNVRGLEGKTKQHSVHSLFLTIQPDMILLQETRCRTYPVLHSFFKLLPNWEFCATCASSLSGGLLTAWNPRRVRYHAFETIAHILVKADFRGMNAPLVILNCYGPYRNQELFWDKVLRGGPSQCSELYLGWGP